MLNVQLMNEELGANPVNLWLFAVRMTLLSAFCSRWKLREIWEWVGTRFYQPQMAGTVSFHIS